MGSAVLLYNIPSEKEKAIRAVCEKLSAQAVTVPKSRHGCTVGDGSLIGMGAVVLTGAVLGDHCLVGAGAVVTGKTVAPAGSMLLGSPAKVVRKLTPEAMAQQEKDALHYVEEAKKALPLR